MWFNFTCRYIIPTPVIKHFLTAVEENGQYGGFCTLDISYQLMENSQLRNHFKMGPEMTGILINEINPLSDAYKRLRKDDIILAIDDVLIGNDAKGNPTFIYIVKPLLKFLHV